MDNDTPRYGSRNEDDAPRRQSDDPPFGEERSSRPSFLDSNRSEDDDGPSFTRTPAEPRPTERSFRSDTGSYGSLEGLRPSRFDSENTSRPERDPYAPPPPRDNGSFRSDTSFDTDRGGYRPSTSTASSFGRSDPDTSNPLLRSEPQTPRSEPRAPRPEPHTPRSEPQSPRSEPSPHRFSWEDSDSERPAPRTSSLSDRDYEPPRHSARNSRLDELNARSEPRAPSNYGSDRSYEPAARTPPAQPAYEPTYEPPDEPAYQPPPRTRDYADAADEYTPDGYYENDRSQRYDPYEAASYQGAHARELADVDENYARDYHYQGEDTEFRQGYDSYNEDFQQFEEPYEEFPQKRRRGPFLLLGSLVAVAVIAGGLIFVYQGLQGTSEPEIPVVTPDTDPVKIQPAPEPTPVSPTPRSRKLIYDRIRGDDAEPDNTLVPRQEEPANPDTQNQSNNAQPSIDDTIIDPSTSTQSTDANGSEPLPLPLPPPPVSNSQDTQTAQPTFNTTNENLNTGGEVVEAVADTPSNDPPAPASQDTVTEVAPTPAPLPVPTPDANDAPVPQSLTQLIESPPLPKEKPVPPSRQAEPGPAVPSGPIQIAPLPGSVDRETTTDDQAANATQPTQLQPASPVEQATQQPTQEPTRRLSSRFSDELNTDGQGTRLNNQVAALPQPTTTPAPAQTQVDTEAPTPVVPQPEAPITGGRYLIQLAAFRSQEEAQAEFQKLQTRHPSLLGSYSSLVQQADLGTRGTYYRLRIGPIETRSNASQLCNSLIAAGERDCLVRER